MKKRYLFIERSILFNCEIISLQNVNNTSCGNLLLIFISIPFRKVDIRTSFFTKEKKVWNNKSFSRFFGITKAIIIHFFIFIVQTVKQSAIEERYSLIC